MGILSKKNALFLDAGRLPPIPHALLRLVEACHKVDVSFDELSGIIQKDPALSAKVIAVANSPSFAQWNGVKDFNRLIVMLGLGAIKSIAITTAVHQFFSQFNAEADRFMSRFWRSSLTCAYTMKSLAQLTGYEPDDEAYLAGLLHNIGQLILLREFSETYPGVVLGAATDGDLDAAERAMFNTTCTEVGALLVDNWGIDSFLSDAILYQHESAQAILDAPRLVKLLNFAHKLSERTTPDEKLFEEADLLFGLTQPLLEELLADVSGEVTKAAVALGIPLGSGGGDPDNAVLQADSERLKLELAKQVRNIALMGGMQQQEEGGDLEMTLRVLQQDLNILFGLPRSLCCLCDAETGALSIAWGDLAGTERAKEIHIPLESGRSLIAEAILQHRVVTSFDSVAMQCSSVVDRQLAKFLGGTELLCIPLIQEQKNIGVLIAGVKDEQTQRLSKQSALLTCFASEAARAVSRCNRLINKQQEILNDDRKQQQEHTRKLLHEVSNPLSIINNYLEILSLQLGDDQATKQQFTVLKEEIERVGGILLRMKDLPEAKEVPAGEVDLNVLIQDLLSIFRVSLFTTHNIQEKLSLDDVLQPLLSNRNSLKQVLTNLVKNAVEAMPDGGTISLMTRGRVNVDGRLYAELMIADTGPGIPDDIIQALFTPVVSTKGKQHSGLGLTIVKKLITNLRGTISCKSVKNNGTEFRILLPVEK